MVLRKLRAALLVTAIATVAVAGLGGPAQAANYNGKCESGEVCLYWGGNYYGGVADFYHDIYNYKSFRFKGSGAGAGQSLNDNSASARNRARYAHAILCTDSYFGGDCMEMDPGDAYPDLGPFNNELSSHFFFG
jgi:hypothetical protein